MKVARSCLATKKAIFQKSSLYSVVLLLFILIYAIILLTKTMKDQIIAALGTVPNLQEKLAQYPVLGEMVSKFSTEIEDKLIQLESNEFVFKVKPSFSIEDALAQGHYNDHYGYLKDEKNAQVFRNLPKDLPEELICIKPVPTGEFVPKGTENVKKFWEDRGYELVPHADAYLVQLMADVPEDKMPPDLKGQHIVAYTETPSFRDEDGYECCLFVYRRDVGYRKLGMARGDARWHVTWAFVLRKIIKPSVK